MDNFDFTEQVLAPDIVQKEFSVTVPVWLYQIVDNKTGWKLSVATLAEKGSNHFSLGGFRILPKDRAKQINFNTDFEAIRLAQGMEEKVYWSKKIGVAGEKGRVVLQDIYGGKCVFLPTDGARVGEDNDFSALNFASFGLNRCVKSLGIQIVTGQDLGHGTMSDNKTTSLNYLYDKFIGFIKSNTAVPTAWGNLAVFWAICQAFNLKENEVSVGLVGCGNIGKEILKGLFSKVKEIYILESSPEKLSSFQGCRVYSPQTLKEFYKQDIDVIFFNSIGGSLNKETSLLIAENPSIKVITGSENLLVADKSSLDLVVNAGKIYIPTEYTGMMGYLTAVEEYLYRVEGEPFSIDKMKEPAQDMIAPTKDRLVQIIENKQTPAIF